LNVCSTTTTHGPPSKPKTLIVKWAIHSLIHSLLCICLWPNHENLIYKWDIYSFIHHHILG
jgi:hypothetical protein